MPWTATFSLAPRPPVDDAERSRWALKSDPRFKAWLRDMDAKVSQHEALRLRDLAG